jgi:Circularly permutated YpsA SLOG family
VLERVVSGGQTGADQAGWRAARASGIAIGGWMPADFLIEDGSRPEFAEMFGGVELPGGGYPERPGPTSATRTRRSGSGSRRAPAIGRRSGPVLASGSRSTW